MRLLKRALRDEKGASLIMVAIAIVVIFGFAVLTIDLSLMQLAKIQLQNAADAAALAGAMALATFEGNEDIATAEAIRVCSLNVAVQDIQRPVIINDADVTFHPSAPGIMTDIITVRTHRTVDDGDPVTLHFLRVLDPLLENRGNMTATATAAFLLVCETDCLRPFCPPDRWHDANGDSIWNPDSGDFYDPYKTGYSAPDDIGVQVTFYLRHSAFEFRAGWYYAIRFGPINTGDPVHSGADAYKKWIMGCEPYTVSIGDLLELENGVMDGPTTEGLSYLINLDPTAEWDPVTGTVINSAFPTSPRIIKVCAFDPSLGVRHDIPGPGYVTVSKIMALFIEGHNGDEVVGRFMKIATQGIPGLNCPGNFLFKVALVPNR